jgi:ubiquinone/menaquinone biosynthesis C-methylase UbiE
MDDYTRSTRDWLNQRFSRTDQEGIYVAHQPIYGFRKGHSEKGSILTRYIVSFQIIRALSHLRFESLLDVGGAEGYKAALARELFGAAVSCCDLSNEACNRAREIFGMDCQPADIQELPFSDNEFEVVLCSETLEHVPDFRQATRELFRVCSKAVVITVPRESARRVRKNFREKIPHAHLHSLDSRSFDFMLPQVSRIVSHKMLSKLTNIPRVLVGAMKLEQTGTYPRVLIDLYNLLVPLMHGIFGKRSAISLIHLDLLLSKLIPIYDGMLFLILKDEGSYCNGHLKHVSAREIIEYCIPYHYLGKESDKIQNPLESEGDRSFSA